MNTCNGHGMAAMVSRAQYPPAQSANSVTHLSFTIKYLVAVLVATFMIWAVPLLANAEQERTIWARDTRTPDPGHFSSQLWLGYETYAYKPVKADGSTETASISLSYGILANWSVGFKATCGKWQETYYGASFSQKGAGDAAANTTLRILDENTSGIDLAVRGSLFIPTGDEDKGLGSGNWEPKLQVSAAKTLGNLLAVTNLGIRRIIDPGRDEEDFILNTSVEAVLPLTGQFSVSASLAAWTPRWKTSQDDIYLQLGGGFRFTLTQDLICSFGLYRLVNSDIYHQDWYAALGLGVEF